MKTALIFALLAASASAAGIPAIAGALSIAASSGQIAKEGAELFHHGPFKYLKHKGKQIKQAAKKGKDAK